MHIASKPEHLKNNISAVKLPLKYEGFHESNIIHIPLVIKRINYILLDICNLTRNNQVVLGESLKNNTVQI